MMNNEVLIAHLTLGENDEALGCAYMIALRYFTSRRFQSLPPAVSDMAVDAFMRRMRGKIDGGDWRGWRNPFAYVTQAAKRSMFDAMRAHRRRISREMEFQRRLLLCRED